MTTSLKTSCLSRCPPLVSSTLVFSEIWIPSTGHCAVSTQSRQRTRYVSTKDLASHCQRFARAKRCQDQQEIDFDDSELEFYQSFEWPKNDPAGINLPPSRIEHEKHLRRMEKFTRAVRKHQDGFKRLIGRHSSCSSCSASSNLPDFTCSWKS